MKKIYFSGHLKSKRNRATSSVGKILRMIRPFGEHIRNQKNIVQNMAVINSQSYHLKKIHGSVQGYWV